MYIECEICRVNCPRGHFLDDAEGSNKNVEIFSIEMYYYVHSEECHACFDTQLMHICTLYVTITSPQWVIMGPANANMDRGTVCMNARIQYYVTHTLMIYVHSRMYVCYILSRLHIMYVHVHMYIM